MNKFDKKTKEMIRKGCHSVGSHSMTHSKTKLYDNGQFVKENKEMLKILSDKGFKTKTIRAPYGSTYLSGGQIKDIRNNKMKLMDWHIDSLDWKLKSAEKVYKRIIKQLKDSEENGVIILLHEKPETVDLLVKLLPYLKDNGYRAISEESKEMEELIFGITK